MLIESTNPYDTRPPGRVYLEVGAATHQRHG